MTEASTKTTRRELLGLASSAGAALVALAGAGGLPLAALAQQRMPQRRIPATGEMLPVIGLGSSKPVEEIAKNGVEPITAVLRALVASGGKLVDTWPRNADNDAAFGRVASLPDLREKPDSIQVNYSITERESEKRILPFAADHGLAVLINRPFMNGTYFDKLKDQPLPDWAAEFECKTWAQFSLKYILANPAVTCVLTETSNPQHMADNAQTSLGPVPNAAQRERMGAFIDKV